MSRFPLGCALSDGDLCSGWQTGARRTEGLGAGLADWADGGCPARADPPRRRRLANVAGRQPGRPGERRVAGAGEEGHDASRRRCPTTRRSTRRSATAGSTARSSAATRRPTASASRRDARAASGRSETSRTCSGCASKAACTRRRSASRRGAGRRPLGRGLCRASKIEVPDDLAAALAAEPRAEAMFEILTSQNRYAVLLRIDSAKRSDTRAGASSSSSRCSRAARPSIRRGARCERRPRAPADPRPAARRLRASRGLRGRAAGAPHPVRPRAARRGRGAARLAPLRGDRRDGRDDGGLRRGDPSVARSREAPDRRGRRSGNALLGGVPGRTAAGREPRARASHPALPRSWASCPWS